MIVVAGNNATIRLISSILESAKFTTLVGEREEEEVGDFMAI